MFFFFFSVLCVTFDFEGTEQTHHFRNYTVVSLRRTKVLLSCVFEAQTPRESRVRYAKKKVHQD